MRVGEGGNLARVAVVTDERVEKVAVVDGRRWVGGQEGRIRNSNHGTPYVYIQTQWLIIISRLGK